MVTGVIPATVDALENLGVKTSRLRAWIGPSIGIDRFEVGAEVAEQFESRFVRKASGLQKKAHVNLKAVAAEQLATAGLPQENISICPDCTHEREELYWSYRRDGGICGRQIAYLGMRAKARGLQRASSEPR